MGKCLIITTTNDLLRLQYDNIVYITSDGNYSQFLLSGGDMRMVTVQLGQIERLIERQLGVFGRLFIRIGKSLIINRDYIYYININQQRLELNDKVNQKYTVQASREALKQLKLVIEKENEGTQRQ
ncbi:MAG: LytTR family transcriptional regulator [Muribaculaceae bacterium]|nr:LytTR family transcriptional regulator [Muribaculaceae bacterium]